MEMGSHKGMDGLDRKSLPLERVAVERPGSEAANQFVRILPHCTSKLKLIMPELCFPVIERIDT